VDNFTAIRNGLLRHINEGKLCPFDLGIYVYLLLRADWSTGIFQGCALTIAYGFNDHSLRHHINKSLSRLRERQYINYRKGDGRRGGYEVLIHKYQVTVGELSGHRLNAWKHGELCRPEYERWNGNGTVEEESGKSGGRVGEPIQDLLDMSQDLKTKKTRAKARTSLPDAFTISPAIRKWASEHGHARLEERLAHFQDWAKSGDKRYADWDACFRNAIRGDWAKLKDGNHNGNNRAEQRQADTINAVEEAKRMLAARAAWAASGTAG